MIRFLGQKFKKLFEFCEEFCKNIGIFMKCLGFLQKQTGQPINKTETLKKVNFSTFKTPESNNENANF